MASSSSSSGSGPNAPRKYDVFVSFRGEETRNNFTSHLHAALNRAFLVAFRDDKQVEKGDEIAPSLTQAIKDSSVSVVVFSKDYASSRWCLDELAQIMQYREDEGQFVIPIFYNVDPSHVRNQTGAYEKAFEEQEKKHRNDPDKVNRWRAALSEAGELSGRHCQTFTDESNLIQEIVADVYTKLERIHNGQRTLKDVIGIDEMIEPIEELLENFHKVGIWGMGGVGKTTMARAVFAKLSSRYDNCCFLQNIREEKEKNGLEHVRDSLVSELLREDMQSNPSIDLRNAAFVERRLSRKKALVVLDDVDSYKQLKDLQDNACNFLGEGSRVIITTRNRKLLRLYGYEIHEAKGLSSDNSCRLFIRKAFGSDHPEDGYEQLIQGFVDYTQHNPLALEVLGSYVHSENIKLWDGLLQKLRGGSPNGEIQKGLRLSYDGLDYEEKQIFLEIACFLKGESEEFVEQLLESYEFHPTVGIQTLKDRALIVTIRGRVEMHDLLQEMGLEIVREESRKKPGKRSRLWDPDQIYEVLRNCEGEEEVEGIKYRSARPLELSAKTFNKMTRLRFLNINSSYSVRIPTRLESISTKIRHFQWVGYPGKLLPSNFCAEHLLEFNLQRSRVETLWEGAQNLANLRRLKIQYCSMLRKLPDFSKACRLESVDLSGCRSLCDVHVSLLSLHSLISLDVRFCSRLRSLKSRIHLKSLNQVKLFLCYNLKEFSLSSEELRSLDFSETGIEELSPSIGGCSKLTALHLGYRKLKDLPVEALSCLTSLKELHISMRIDSVEEVGLALVFDALRSLEKLYFNRWWRLTKLPDNIRHLSQLQCLFVEACHALRSLPELPPSLRILNANGCTSLEKLATSTISSTSENHGEKIFSFDGCVKLDWGAIEEQAKGLFQKAVHEKEDVTVIYPGKKVPQWFGNTRSPNDSDTVQLSLPSHNLVGFVFCAVVPDLLGLIVPLEISFGVKRDEMTTEIGFKSKVQFHRGNVLLCSNPKLSESILEKIEGKGGNHEATTYNRNLFFKFSFHWSFRHRPTKECGVYPIYASE